MDQLPRRGVSAIGRKPGYKHKSSTAAEQSGQAKQLYDSVIAGGDRGMAIDGMKIMWRVGEIGQLTKMQLDKLPGDKSPVPPIGLLVEGCRRLHPGKKPDPQDARGLFQQSSRSNAYLEDVLIGLQPELVDDPAVQLSAAGAAEPACRPLGCDGR